ncbi:MAG: glycosyltransferase family 4 protein [Sulfurovaceae bacterium]|nr:glycosyltransferase family 4 protein [Sulfurovaceae bacterium]MDD5548522.1 glycosyltransferase family 4 protein [Sulfurovaceae bacterium]
MKIVQLLPELNEGGVERGTVELNREFVKLGHESVVISNGGKQVEAINLDGGKYIKFDIASKNPFTAISRVYGLRKLLKELNPDVIHARSRVPAWLTYLANKTLHIPFVTTVHGLNSVNKYSQIMTKGDKVICVSEVVRDYIIKNYNVDKRKITVIQRGVDTDLFNSSNVDFDFIHKFKKQFNLDGKFIVSSIGRITWLKDYETFIKSIAIAKKDIPNIVGLIVGGYRDDKKEYFESLKELAIKENVENNIIFTGSISKIAEIYYLSDILVNASLKMGNVGRTVSESLAMGTPVIATTFEGLNNIIKDGINGYVIENKNIDDLSSKIIKLFKNMPSNIQDTLPTDFTLKAMTQSTISVYENLLNSKKSLS